MVAHLKTDHRKAALAERDRAMLDFVAKGTRHHNEVTEVDIQALRDVGFDDGDILDVIYWIGAFNMANTLTDLTGLEVHEHVTYGFVDGAASPNYDTNLQLTPVRPDRVRAVVRPLEGARLDWINSAPLRWRDLGGRTLLVHYWDVTHPNSLLAVPHLKQWHEKYTSDELLILAVHRPEFLAAKKPELIKREIERLGIRYPVVLEPKARMSTAGEVNRYWPVTHLIDPDGYVRARHHGPGGLEVLHDHLGELLREKDPPDERIPIEVSHQPGFENPSINPRASSELYTYRSTSAHQELLLQVDELPRQLEDGRLYAVGEWRTGQNGLNMTSKSGRLAFRCRTRQVGMFLTPPSDSTARFKVRLNEQVVPDSLMGEDLSPGSEMKVKASRFYWLVCSEEMDTHRLDVEVLTPGTWVHRFNFLPSRGVVGD